MFIFSYNSAFPQQVICKPSSHAFRMTYFIHPSQSLILLEARCSAEKFHWTDRSWSVSHVVSSVAGDHDVVICDVVNYETLVTDVDPMYTGDLRKAGLI
jgi:hypothetical protein